MYAAFGSALGKEKIKMKKEDVCLSCKQSFARLYDIPVLFELCCQNMNKL